jgi:hypothetical protein
MRDTIELAREAGFPMAWISDNDGGVILWKDLKAFADLIRADEREACAKVCDRIVEGKDPDDIHSDSQWAALSLAAAIRARGNT